MARRKRNSSVLEKADRRIESYRSISETLDLGEGLTIDAFKITIDDLRSKLAVYNTALSSIDKLADDVRDAERTVKELSEKMLLVIGGRYGKTSQEYEMAGGSRRKNNRRSTSKTSFANRSANTAQPSSKNGSTNRAAPTAIG